MKKLKIAIDCDNTLFRNDIVDNVIEEFKIELESSYHWFLEELGKKGKNECFKRFKNPEYMCYLNPIRGNKKKIKEWHKNGYELVCVTARDLSLTKLTIDMVKKHFPVMDRIILCNGFDKTAIYSKEKFDIVIDDNSDNIKQALTVKTIKKIYFITNKNTPYNFDSIKEFRKYKRIINVTGMKDINDI